MFCAVVGCSMREEKDNVKFYSIPAAVKTNSFYLNELSKNRRKYWIKALKLPNFNRFRNLHICSRHFITGAPAQLEEKYDPDWIPTQHMAHVSSSSINKQSPRYENCSGQETKPSSAASLVEKYTKEDPLEGCSHHYSVTKVSVAVQTDLTMEDITKLYEDLAECDRKILGLQEKLKENGLSLETFQNNNSKTLQLTGLPKYEIMFEIFNDIRSYLPQTCALPLFKQFLLTLMKLRLNLPFDYLGYKFEVSAETASQIFYECIDVFYERYKSLVFWPSREMLQKNVPVCFKEIFGNQIAVIVDCLEVYTERPSDCFDLEQLPKVYKISKTVKFLLGITAQGTISFTSEAYGGICSDKFITDNCGFLNLIVPGDTVLADQDFLIRDDSLTLDGFILRDDDTETLEDPVEISVFTKGENILRPANSEKTQNIANLGMKVKKFIGLLKEEFLICHGPVPISMLTVDQDKKCTLDKIVVVCSALLNLCSSVIPLK